MAGAELQGQKHKTKGPQIGQQGASKRFGAGEGRNESSLANSGEKCRDTSLVSAVLPGKLLR